MGHFIQVLVSLSAKGEKRKTHFFLGMSGEETGSGSHFLWRPGDFLSSEPHRKPVFLVDSIIELCINVQEMCAQGCGSINLSLPVSFSEIEQRGPPDGAAPLLEFLLL